MLNDTSKKRMYVHVIELGAVINALVAYRFYAASGYRYCSYYRMVAVSKVFVPSILSAYVDHMYDTSAYVCNIKERN